MPTFTERIEDIRLRTKEHAEGTLTTEQVMSLQHDIDDVVKDISPDLRHELVDALDLWYRIHRLNRRFRDRRSDVSGRP
jgi:hypothetical protein